MFSKETLKPGTKLRAMNAYKDQTGVDEELEVLQAFEKFAVVKSLADGKERSPEYNILESFYEIVPELEATEENFIPRTFMLCEEMISYMSAFNQTGNQQAMIELGTRLHALKDEAAVYLKVEEATTNILDAAMN